MKLIFSVVLLFTLPTFAQSFVNIDGLYSRAANPAFASFMNKFEIAKVELKDIKLTQDQTKLLEKVSKEFSSGVVEATLYRKPSRGPSWKQAMIDRAEAKSDPHEAASYWGEDFDEAAHENCGFKYNNGDSTDIQEDYTYTWKFEAVKRKSNDKSIAYIMTLLQPLRGKSPTGNWVLCNYPIHEYVFPNKAPNQDGVVHYNDEGDH